MRARSGTVALQASETWISASIPKLDLHFAISFLASYQASARSQICLSDQPFLKLFDLSALGHLLGNRFERIALRQRDYADRIPIIADSQFADVLGRSVQTFAQSDLHRRRSS
jgi:hypothetical protein